MSLSVSIIIRSKNEEKWIGSCLKAISKQDFPKKKIEVILVDNESTDGTVSIAKKHKVRILNFKPEIYKPGEALNYGIKFAKNDICVFLSAHCIPANRNWLRKLISGLEETKIAAVYGRQLPYQFSDPSDKRDLFNQFGVERRIQTKDNFFHNANSAIKKNFIKKFPFDNNVYHIEDRIWATNILERKFKIIYEPDAKVWHFHGLNHSNNLPRSSGIAKIIDKYMGSKYISKGNITETHNLPIFISHDPKMKILDFKKKFFKLQKILKMNKFESDIVIVGSNRKLKLLEKNKNLYFFYSKEKTYTTTIRKFSYALKQYEKKLKITADAVVMLDVNYILPKYQYYKFLINLFFEKDFDTVIPVKKDLGMFWKKDYEGKLLRIDDPNAKVEKEPMFKGLGLFASVTKRSLVLNNIKIGHNVGCVEV